MKTVTGEQRYWNPYIYRKGDAARTYPGAFGPDMFCDFVIDFAGKRLLVRTSRHKGK